MDLGTIKKLSKAEQKFKIKIPLCINKKGREKFPKNPKKKKCPIIFSIHTPIFLHWRTDIYISLSLNGDKPLLKIRARDGHWTNGPVCLYREISKVYSRPEKWETKATSSYHFTKDPTLTVVQQFQHSRRLC